MDTAGPPPTPVTDVREALLAAARAELTESGHGAISLRAVARRAGVSHAAPKYHFQDRAGLLTAIATEGFVALTDALRRVDATVDVRHRIAALGKAYIDFGLAHPALFDLMFRPTELHADDRALGVARQEAVGTLSDAVGRHRPGEPASRPPHLALTCWALAHGLAVLTRDGALGAAAGLTGPDAAADLAHDLTDTFTGHLDTT